MLYPAHGGVFPKEGAAAESRVPGEPQLFRQNVQQGGLARAVSAVKDGHRGKGQLLQSLLGEDLEGIDPFVAGALLSHDKGQLLPLGNQLQLLQIQVGHRRTLLRF